MRFAWTFASALLVAATAHAYPPRHTSAVVGDVTVDGVALNRSTGSTREPQVTLTNRGGAAHVVDVVGLDSLDADDLHAVAMRPTGTTHRVLAAHETYTWSISFDGQPQEDGVGLPYTRFRVHVRVDGHDVSVIASNAYVCRIPVRH